MSLLDGLKEAMINPIFDSVMESDIDEDLDFELAIEAAVDQQIELSEEDIAAILDDENPDNITADITTKDEKLDKIAEDTVNDELNALEAMLDEFLANEMEMPEEDDPKKDPESMEGCSKKACETDDDDDYEDEEDDDDESEDDGYLSLDSLLDSVFNN